MAASLVHENLRSSELPPLCRLSCSPMSIGLSEQVLCLPLLYAGSPHSFPSFLRDTAAPFTTPANRKSVALPASSGTFLAGRPASSSCALKALFSGIAKSFRFLLDRVVAVSSRKSRQLWRCSACLERAHVDVRVAGVEDRDSACLSVCMSRGDRGSACARAGLSRAWDAVGGCK